jgi:NitT/TauT family transport system ATP-binding protein
MATEDDVFIAESLECRYGTGPLSVMAISGLSFHLRRGEFVSIVGPSGCGKSTLLRIVAGVVAPTGGRTAGTYTSDRMTGRVAMMFQSPVLVPWRSTLGNVLLIEELRNGRLKNRGKAEARARQLLDLVRLTEFTRMYPFELSGGMQQRVALARALFLDPALMLLDEPFGALDAFTREEMNLELQRIWMTRKPTVLLVTHDLSEALFLSDRVVLMSDRPGRVLLERKVGLPRPRSAESKYDPSFLEAHHEIHSALESGMKKAMPQDLPVTMKAGAAR